METKIENKEDQEFQKTKIKAILYVRTLQEFAKRQGNELANDLFEMTIRDIKEACEAIERVEQRKGKIYVENGKGLNNDVNITS